MKTRFKKNTSYLTRKYIYIYTLTNKYTNKYLTLMSLLYMFNSLIFYHF